jgi:drug/metabolite transporter (DMT)-like permease
MSPEARPPATAYLFVGLAILLWGTSFWPVEAAGDHASPLALAALRTFPAGVLLLLCLPLLRARLPRGEAAWWAAVTGVLMVGFFFYALTEGTIRAGAGNAAVLVNTSPFIVVLLGRLLSDERIAAIGLVGLVAGFAGVVVMVSSQLGGGGDGVVAGLGLALGASLAWAIGTLLIKRLVNRVPDLDLVGFTAVQYAVGGTALALVALPLTGRGDVDWGAGALWVPLAYLIVGASALASVAYFSALKRMTATRTAAGLFLVPAVAVLVDLVRGSVPGPVVLAGMAVTIVGVALVNLPGRAVVEDHAPAAPRVRPPAGVASSDD